MEGLLVGRLIDARGRDVDVAAEIPHVAEDMALAVLRDRLAEPGADAEEGRGRLLDAVALDRNAAQNDEAAPGGKIAGPHPGERSAEPRQRKVLAVDGDVLDAAVDDRADRGVDLGDLGLGQSMGEI